ncbi:MAG: hypothetical protein IVW56_08840 [Candidatus Binataceae bacterium]|nr:hypothetical protein [Candidatus Binataceae bacterium]
MAAPFSPIPKIYGARRIFPQYAASPYNELVGFDQYLRMLFLLGYGPLDISQIKIGDTALEDYEDVEWELRAGFADDAPTRLYPGAVSEVGLNIQLSKTNGGGLAPAASRRNPPEETLSKSSRHSVRAVKNPEVSRSAQHDRMRLVQRLCGARATARRF